MSTVTMQEPLTIQHIQRRKVIDTDEDGIPDVIEDNDMNPKTIVGIKNFVTDLYYLYNHILKDPSKNILLDNSY